MRKIQIMQLTPSKYEALEDPQPNKLLALWHHYHGAFWGLLAGMPIGIATTLNLSLSDPLAMIAGFTTLWTAGGFCGHNMQLLLEGTR